MHIIGSEAQYMYEKVFFIGQCMKIVISFKIVIIVRNFNLIFLRLNWKKSFDDLKMLAKFLKVKDLNLSIKLKKIIFIIKPFIKVGKLIKNLMLRLRLLFIFKIAITIKIANRKGPM